MSFFKRKYKRRPKIGFDQEMVKQIIAIGFLLLGGLFILALFNIAGVFGQTVKEWFLNFLGFLGWPTPFIMVFLAIGYFFPRLRLPFISYIGLAILIIFLPPLINPYGGAFGTALSDIFIKYFGSIASFVIFLVLVLVGIFLTFNISVIALWQRLTTREGEAYGKGRVSVFATVRKKLIPPPKGGEAPVAPKMIDSTWQPPPMDLLEVSTSKATSGNIAKNVDVVQKTLRDFGIEVGMGDVNIGPTVTQYTFKPAEGVKLANIVARQNDIALALAAHPIRVEAPIPGKSAVGIEVPNKVPALVTLREVLEADDFKAAKGDLLLALGRGVAGEPRIVDLAKMPHLLIAGATGSGKSVCINGIILSLSYQHSPQSLRFLLVDPKRVEFTMYNGVPHLLTPVIVDVDKTVNALRWAISEMERRFKLFAQSHRRNIDEYNQNPTDGKLPYIIVIIDELADLMAQAANEVEAAIVRLAQMARATGIHLIVATQRPSVDVITGLIKANITSRIAFAVASQVDSRTILDQAGAEKLLGKGDMLFQSSDLGKPRRIQGVMVSDKDIKAVTDYLKGQSAVYYDESILEFRPPSRLREEMAIDDDLYEDAKAVVTQAGKASASLLQRRLRVGYARAARLLDLLEQEGMIGPGEGAKPRDVLVEPGGYTPRSYRQEEYQSQNTEEKNDSS